MIRTRPGSVNAASTRLDRSGDVSSDLAPTFNVA